MFYITGDVHRKWNRVMSFCSQMGTTKNDVMIVLGDAGINYYGAGRDAAIKEYLSSLNITLFCVHGNHENRPQNIPSYRAAEFCGGNVYVEPEYPNLIFADDGQIYNLNGKKCMVIGGAYSVDKYFRLSQGRHWWPDEQPDDAIKDKVEQALVSEGYSVDAFLTHTCPFKYIPTEMFLPCIDQSTVDNSTELWLDQIEDACDYKEWYCGHYHTTKQVDKLQFMFENYKIFD